MNSKRRYIVLSSVTLTILLLGALVFAFSYEPTAKKLENNGLKFTSFTDIKNSLFPEKKDSFVKQKKQLQVTANRSLTEAEKKHVDTLRAKVVYLENFPLGKDNTCLSSFFASLQTTGDSVIHIWYYGDSQIEGDRVTGELRDLMQPRFGGTGTGYVPFSDLATFRYFELKTGTSLVKYNCFTNRGNKGFGFAGKVYKFNTKDSNFSSETGIWVSPKLKYSRLYLTYGQHTGGKLKIKGADSSGKSLSIPAETNSGRVLLSSNAPHGNLKFSLPAGGNYYGLMFEGNSGIQIDNCGIRGHSGDGLKFITDAVILKEAATWNTKLIVFHFGNNMIPVIKSGKKNMDYYSKYFEAIFSRYHRLLPNVSLLVVSAGDMGTVRNGEEQGYPNLPEFVDCMRTAALNSGCAFFDAHAMIAKDGGILGWKRKGYAGLDGHLTPSGQRKFATALYNELMREYEVYQIIKQQP